MTEVVRMWGLVVGFAMGWVAFTDQGHEVGNAASEWIMKNAKSVVKGGEYLARHWNGGGEDREQHRGSTPADK